MPCKDQNKELFLDALRSMVRQTSPHWILLILVDPSSPPELAEWASTFPDDRIRFVRCPEPGFAQALNHGLAIAASSFVSILLSDDRYSPRAMKTLLRYRARFPAADFFHSARQLITLDGAPCSEVIPSRATFGLDDFKTLGSPVKALAVLATGEVAPNRGHG